MEAAELKWRPDAPAMLVAARAAAGDSISSGGAGHRFSNLRVSFPSALYLLRSSARSRGSTPGGEMALLAA